MTYNNDEVLDAFVLKIFRSIIATYIMSSTKVVVVGAGPVGSLAALYAAQRGYDVEIYELRNGMISQGEMILTSPYTHRFGFHKTDYSGIWWFHGHLGSLPVYEPFQLTTDRPERSVNSTTELHQIYQPGSFHARHNSYAKCRAKHPRRRTKTAGSCLGSNHPHEGPYDPREESRR